MARIRTIKPEFFTSPDIASLSLTARLTFVGIWTFADDYGVAPAEPRLIKGAVWPLDDDVTREDVARALDELAQRDLIARYAVDGRDYLHVCAWEKHQRVDRPSKTRYPGPDQAEPEGSRATRDILATDRRALDVGTRNEERGTRTVTSPSTVLDDGFEAFWDAYPARDGKKLDKARAQRVWQGLSRAKRDAAMVGVANYSASGVRPRDAHRWLRDAAWTDWQTPAAPDAEEPAGWRAIRAIGDADLGELP